MLYHNTFRAAAVLLCLAAPLHAEPLEVITDIAPVHSLAAQVMGQTGAPTLLVEPGASPHDTALRPSRAAALERADIVFWIGPELTPWLERPLSALAPEARRIALMPLAPVHHANRETAIFDDDGHDHDHDHGHDHGDDDPHAWLDPVNAMAWLDIMADAFAAADPGQADTYRANATDAQAALAQLQLDLAATLTIARPHAYMTDHDALQYFEHRFGLTPLGALAASDDARPGPRRIQDIRAHAAAHDLRCIFVSPNAPTGLVDTAFAGMDTTRVVLDITGQGLTPGADLYAAMLRDMADAMAGCLTLQ